MDVAATHFGWSLRGCLSGLGAVILALALGAATPGLASPVFDWSAVTGGGLVDANAASSCRGHRMVDAAGNTAVVAVYAAWDASFLAITKYSPDGSRLWSVEDRGSTRLLQSDHPLCAFAMDATGNVYVSGESLPGENGRVGLVVAKFAAADGQRLWSARTVDVGLSLWNGAIAVDSDGNVVAHARGLGSSLISGQRLFKFHRDSGQPFWSQREYQASAPLDTNLLVTSFPRIGIDANDNIVVSGTRGVAKISGASGDWAWGNLPAGISVVTDAQFFAQSLALDMMGDVLLAGTAAVYDEVTGEELDADLAVIKLDADTGSPTWGGLPNGVFRYSDPAGGLVDGLSVAVDAAGNAVISGAIRNATYTTGDAIAIKLDGATGLPTWNGLPGGVARFDGAAGGYDEAVGVAVDGIGNLLVTGRSENADGDLDVIVGKYAGASGLPLWNALPELAARYDGPVQGDDSASRIDLDAVGDTRVLGFSDGPINRDMVLLRHRSSDGAQLWDSRREPQVWRAHRIVEARRQVMAVDAAGNTLIAGTEFDGTCDVWVTSKISPAGQRLWSVGLAAQASTSTSKCGAPTALGVDAAGNVFVTGVQGSNSGTGELPFGAWATVKYASSDGAPLWTGLPGEVARPLLESSSRGPRALAVDAEGNVVVTGGVGTGGAAFATIKYAGATGAPIWTGLPDGVARYKGTGISPHEAAAVAIDGQGHVYVTGESSDASSGSDFATLKYHGGTGQPLWTGLPDGAARYNGPGNSSDAASRVLVSADGNIVVTGYSTGSGSGRDYATIKYASATGAPLWTGLTGGAARYNGPANAVDEPMALAVGPSGEVYVTGRSEGIGTGFDWATLQYQGATGAVAWTDLPAGALRRDHGARADVPQAIAVDVNGGHVAVVGSRTNSDGSLGATMSWFGGSSTGSGTFTGPGNLMWHSASFTPGGDLRLGGVTGDALNEPFSFAGPRIHVVRYGNFNGESDLAGLSLTSGVLNPTFRPFLSGYTASVPFATSATQVTATVSTPGATLLINGNSAFSGQQTPPIALAVGDNVVMIVVTAADGVTKRTYRVTVTRQSNDPRIFRSGFEADES